MNRPPVARTLATLIKARYGVDLPPSISNRSILTALKPGYCAVLQGSMSAFGSTHRLSTWDRNFDSSHAVYVANIDGTYYWCDPEAPTTAAVPVTVSAAELTAFVNAFAGGAIVAPIKQEKPLRSFTFTNSAEAGTLTLNGDDHQYLDLATGLRHAVTAAALATKRAFGPILLTPDIDGNATTGDRALAYLIGDGAAAVLVKDVTFKSDAGIALAALADCTATVESQAAAIAGLKTDLAAAPAKERARVATAEANRIKAL